MGQRFAILGGAALAVLIGTGSYLATRRLPSFNDLFDTAFGRRLSEKLALVVLVILLTVVHAAIQGPRLRRLRQRALGAPDDAALQAEIRSKEIGSGIVSAVLLSATLAIIVIAASL